MEDIKKSSRIHPLVAGAAVAVILVSLVGVAAITGILPNSSSSNVPASNTATPPVAWTSSGSDGVTEKPAVVEAPVPALAPAPIVQQPQASPHHRAHPVVAQTASVCGNCGRVEAVIPIQHEGKASGLGVAAGAVLGGVLGHQVGGGNGRSLATVAGAVGGGYAGNEVEKRRHETTTYEVHVKMDNGSERTFPYTESPGYGAGDRVRVVDGHLTSRG